MVCTDTILVDVSQAEGSGKLRVFTWDISKIGSQPDVRGRDIASRATWPAEWAELLPLLPSTVPLEGSSNLDIHC